MALLFVVCSPKFGNILAIRPLCERAEVRLYAVFWGGFANRGIPGKLDRLIQQALLQLSQPLTDPHFFEHSYSSRPGRSAHRAVRQARAYLQQSPDCVSKRTG